MRIFSCTVFVLSLIFGAALLDAQTQTTPSQSVVEQAQSLLESSKQTAPRSPADPLDDIIAKLDEVIERGRRVKGLSEAGGPDAKGLVPQGQVPTAPNPTTTNRPFARSLDAHADAQEFTVLVQQLREIVGQLRELVAQHKKDQ